MAGRIPRPYSLLFIVAQALWVLPAVQPASAQVLLPPNFISADVPHDVPSGSGASIQDLAIFAWREFVALNWVAMDPATTGIRGRPNVNADFLNIKADTDGNFPLLVWQTYRHKNELFPADGQTDPNFDSSVPTYKYKGQPSQAGSATFNLFNNLDDTSEIGLCTMFAHNTIRVAYEAKVNRAIFDYANNPINNNSNNKLTYCDDLGNCPPKTVPPTVPPPDTGLTARRTNTVGLNGENLAKYGGICKIDPSISSSIILLPCGDAAVAGDAGEGAIEIKAAWRQLTDDEMKKGRFFTQNVIIYKGKQYGGQTYNNAVYGLVALHIIHKTKSFPAFVFASWEQIDNYDDQNTQNLVFINTGTQLPVTVTRAHPIHSQIPPVNDAVRAAFMAKDPTTIWRYYKLIGVQATPVNGPPLATAPMDDLSYYYLANIVVETNHTLQNFFGKVDSMGNPAPFQNVYLNGASGSPFQMGGCQGCHGTQGQSIGGDMSRLIGAAPTNSTLAPESIDATEAEAVKSYLERTKEVIKR
jgi:hypothetical protein